MSFLQFWFAQNRKKLCLVKFFRPASNVQENFYLVYMHDYKCWRIPTVTTLVIFSNYYVRCYVIVKSHVWRNISHSVQCYVILKLTNVTWFLVSFRFSRHCEKCDFDVCFDCFKPHITPLHGHPLYRADSYHVYGRFSPGWRCDNCDSGHNSPSDNRPWHCQTCKQYDLCRVCIRATIKGKIKCSRQILYHLIFFCEFFQLNFDSKFKGRFPYFQSDFVRLFDLYCILLFGICRLKKKKTIYRSVRIAILLWLPQLRLVGILWHSLIMYLFNTNIDTYKNISRIIFFLFSHLLPYQQ